MLPPKSLSATKPKKSWAPNQYELDSDLSEPDAVPGEGATDSEFFHQRFRNFLYVEFLGPRKTLIKLRNLCLDWLQPEIRTKEEIIEVLVLEQYLTILPEKIKPWVQARKPDNCEKLVALLEDYEEMNEPEGEPRGRWGPPPRCSGRIVLGGGGVGGVTGCGNPGLSAHKGPGAVERGVAGCPQGLSLMGKRG